MLPLVYQLFGCPKQKSIKLDLFLLFLSPRRTEISMFPWDELQKRARMENTFMSLSPYAPGKVLSRESSWCQTIPVSGHCLGHRTNVCHVCVLLFLLKCETLKQLLSSVVLRKVKEMHLMLGGTRAPGNCAQPGQT